MHFSGYSSCRYRVLSVAFPPIYQIAGAAKQSPTHTRRKVLLVVAQCVERPLVYEARKNGYRENTDDDDQLGQRKSRAGRVADRPC
jgi:hypothetical protein